MNFVILNGSAQANGNTFSLLSKVTNIIEHRQIKIEIINISEKIRSEQDRNTNIVKKKIERFTNKIIALNT